MGLGELSPLHIILILVIALIVIGPGKLPEVGGAIGKSIREFRKASSGEEAPAAPAAPIDAQAQHAPPPAAAVPPPPPPTPTSLPADIPAAPPPPPRPAAPPFEPQEVSSSAPVASVPEPPDHDGR